MSEVKLKFGQGKRGAFYLENEGKQIGEMAFGVSETTLTVYHTEVDPDMEGKGLAKKMMDAMVEYAREKKLQVLPLCEYVHLQFRRHEDEYADIWKK